MKFNKKLCAFSVAAMMTLGAYTPVLAETATPTETAKIQVNGKMAEDTVILKNGISYVKVEDVKDIFGIDCKVEGEYTTLTVDGKDIKMPFYISDGLISIRDIVTTLDYTVGWDNESKTVIIVDFNKIVSEKNATFDILKKYTNYAYSLGDSFKGKSEFKGGIEVSNEGTKIAIPFSGDADAASSKSGQTAKVNMKMDLAQLKNNPEFSKMPAEQKAFFETIINSIESNTTNVIYDLEKGVYYINSSMFTIFGVDKDTWISMDINSLVKSSGAKNFDMGSLVTLVQNGDIDKYILSVLKAAPVNSINSYNDINTAYDLIVSMLADNSFKLEDGEYKTSCQINQDGTELTYLLTMGTNGNDINSCKLTMKMSANGVIMDMEVSTDENLDSKMSYTMSVADMMKIYFDFTSDVEPTKELPNLNLPTGAKVVSFSELLGLTEA